MIRNDRQLVAAQAQIAQMQRALAEMRGTTSAEEFRVFAKSSRTLIERLQREILDYLTSPNQQITPLPASVP